MEGLKGRLQSIRIFIAQLADQIHPFSHLLHKGITYKWDEKCDKTFQQIKDYLLTPPMLMPPILNKPLILYISATSAALGSLLAHHDETGKERAIYYISSTLVGYKMNYSPIEKACLAVVFTSQKFRHYILSHQIKLISKVDPLKYLLSKATLTIQMPKWVMILTEFDIEYVE